MDVAAPEGRDRSGRVSSRRNACARSSSRSRDGSRRSAAPPASSAFPAALVRRADRRVERRAPRRAGSPRPPPPDCSSASRVGASYPMRTRLARSCAGTACSARTAAAPSQRSRRSATRGTGQPTGSRRRRVPVRSRSRRSNGRTRASCSRSTRSRRTSARSGPNCATLRGRLPSCRSSSARAST